MREQERFDSKIKGATYVLTSKNSQSKHKMPSAIAPNHNKLEIARQVAAPIRQTDLGLRSINKTSFKSPYIR